jgi:hypothetical protein
VSEIVGYKTLEEAVGDSALYKDPARTADPEIQQLKTFLHSRKTLQTCFLSASTHT